MRHNLRHRMKEQNEQERAADVRAGLVSERYAGVSRIELHMTYYHRSRDPILMERTLCYWPTDYARFQLKCEQNDCTGGGYDLAPVVAGLARSRKSTAKGKLFCHGASETSSHASIAYEVRIQYHKDSR